MPASAFTVHQLRYWLAFRRAAAIELQRQGHAYMRSLAPWIVLLLAIAAGMFMRALGRALGGRCSLPRYTVSFAALWLTSTTCLVAIYVCQESLEGLFATGHPAGLTGIFGHGGLWSVPAAAFVGVVLAAAFHGAIGCCARSRTGAATVSRAGGFRPCRVGRSAEWWSRGGHRSQTGGPAVVLPSMVTLPPPRAARVRWPRR
jgi:hypothetical protein